MKRKYFITGEQVMTVGASLMIAGALLALLYILIWLWVPIPDFILKIAASGIAGGFFVAIIGLFLPNNW